MNLHAIVANVISAVNPTVIVTVKVSTGWTQGSDGKRTPTYATPVEVPAQIQALSFGDIQHMDALNIQGTRRAIYFYGEVDGLVRPDNKGGDLVVFPDSSVWLVAMVDEQWNDGASNPAWCRVLATLQNGG